ncbi:lipid-A-disaccharide synthase [Taibaiella koreensis]|uniref:lipid-A-disaccharide synthase n=1 Tax=Taibaiella koreensis TaxID=1268548 RepID=UPI000E59B62A|nr:lipid-A-disaccharide synthase [Taibaiella koreensis]
MRYYIIAGEASGDLHGGNLIKALHRQDGHADVRCWGGDQMEAAGAALVKHYRDLAFMGFVEVIRHLGTIMNNIKFCKQDILAYKPDVLVLIDYPGFNLRIADWAKKAGIRVCYYISPQLWAWKENRIGQIKRSVDKMLVILPFEKAFYDKHHYPVTYVGHPLTEVVDAALKKTATPLSDKKIVALLPGSRSQEIRKKLPVMLSMVKRFPGYQFVIAQAPGQEDTIYRELCAGMDVLLLRNQTYDLLQQASAALVTSGTATLETALFGVPEVVCYKGNPVSYWLAKRLIKVKYISLVNLILDKPAVKELIQDDLNEEQLYQELNELLHHTERREALQSDYTKLWELLGSDKASEKAASEILAMMA